MRSGPLFAAIILVALTASPVAAAEEKLCASAGTGTDYTGCLWRAFEARQAELAALEARIERTLEPNEIASLKASQEEWVRYRDSACQAGADLYGGGTGGLAERPRCGESLTRERIRHLTETYMWAVEKREDGERYRSRQ